MELGPGTMVNANVRLVELLGRGGMGSVWLADHLGLQARVAVKFLSPELVAAAPSLKERFRREASIGPRLRSIHVVQSFDHGVMADGSPYIVMELLEGETLTQRVEGDGPMPSRLVAMMMAQIVKVLHRAHVLGIVHRDIKPDNIFITEDSDYELFVKVLDFGIAKQQRVGADAVTKTGVVVGTPEFMSPEQAISSKNIDYRADLFSLAVVAYYSLTGELPYDTESDEPLWLQMAEGKHIPPSRRAPELPEALDRWFNKALSAKPEDRFQSARMMVDAFAVIVEPDAAQQIVDELSTSNDVDDPRTPDDETPTEEVPDSDDSQPAMYDLLGPDSEEYGSEATVMMNDADHRAAEVEGEGPPTERRPRAPESSALRAEASNAALSAVRAGVYNAGIRGAYNRNVGPTLIDDSLSGPSLVAPTLFELEPPTRRQRRPVMWVAVAAIAVLGATLLAVIIHFAS